MTDEDIVPFDALTQRKQELLQNSPVMPRIYLSIENSELEPTQNCTLYIIEVGIQKGQCVYIHHVHKRYSALNQFDEIVRPVFSYPPNLISFPPKKLFGNKDSEFIGQRAQALQNYILSLLRVPGMVETPAFIRFFEINPNLLKRE